MSCGEELMRQRTGKPGGEAWPGALLCDTGQGDV